MATMVREERFLVAHATHPTVTVGVALPVCSTAPVVLARRERDMGGGGDVVSSTANSAASAAEGARAVSSIPIDAGHGTVVRPMDSTDAAVVAAVQQRQQGWRLGPDLAR